jgi:pimeloyl-ACP methyl ester carboxylesterase
VATYGHAPAPARVAAPKPKSRVQKRLTYWSVVVVVVVLGGWGARRAADSHLRAVSVLTRLTNPNATGWATSFAHHPFLESTGSAETPQGPLRYRVYVPLDVSHPPAIVLLHGIHKAGIEEPRLINFGRTLARAGVEVMTPELKDLADYQVTPGTVEAIGNSAMLLSEKTGEPKVGILGLSFAGGLALLAADRPEYAPRIGFVAAVGAHDDMARVARFFAANMIEKPDGSSVAFQAHEYGALVLAYSHPEDFFPPRDVAIAREALRLWLWEQPAVSMKTADGMSREGKRELDELLHHRAQLQQTFFREIERHQAEMQAVSPHSHVADLRVPVYLLHGSTDSIIPASETQWLSKDVPQAELRRVLISPAMNMIHVDGQHPATAWDKWALVDFMASLLRAADRLGRAKP